MMPRRAAIPALLLLLSGSILPTRAQSGTDIILRPGSGATVSGGWIAVADTTAAGGRAVRHPNAGAAKIAQALAQPVNVGSSQSGLGFDYYHHEVAVGSLTASTTCTYEATLTGLAVASASFRTAPATGSGEISFVAIGDSGTGSPEQRQIAALIAADSSDLMLHAGDIAYGNTGGTGDASYRTFNDWFFDVYASMLQSRGLYTTEGNHDSRPSNGNGAAYLDAFRLPMNGASPAYPDHAERYYSFDYGRVHFVVLDTEFAFQDTTRRAEQLSWLESNLAGSRQPWKIALFHRSPYSAGGEHGSDLAVRDAFGPLFEQYGVQLVVSGHEHDYERTRPTRASTTGTAVTYIVTGGGGAPLYPSATGTWTAYSASRHHYVRADVTECTLSARAIGLDGSPFDSVTLDRCGPGPEAGEIVLYASEATVAGRWVVETDSTAAADARIRHPDGAAAKLTTALAQPANYFELTFDAAAGVPYRLWMRGKADRNYWGNDSVFAQFDNSVNASGAAQFRIGTIAATEINLEDCSGCGLAGWGWQDNGWGAGVMGPLIRFSQSGSQRIRVQTREDGLAIDQIVLSPGRYLNAPPGALKNDNTILIRP